MSGQLIGGIIGAAIGFFTPIGPAYGWMIGAAIGGAVAPGSLPEAYGPRLSDLRPQSSEYGRPLPIVYGSVGIAGNVIFAAPLIELAIRTEQGGKGSTPSQGTTQYTYYGTFAVAFCEGVRSLGRVWAGPEKRLIWDGSTLEGANGVTAIAWYDGSETQMPDATLESILGVGNVPAYRGTCYLVFFAWPLANDGNRIPFITAEVGTPSTEISRVPVYLGASAPAGNYHGQVLACVDPTNGNIWSVTQYQFSETLEVRVNSDVTKTQIASFSIPVPSTWSPQDIVYMPAVDGEITGPLGTVQAVLPARIIVQGAEWLAKDAFAYFNADTVTFDSAEAGQYVGTGAMHCVLWNPVTLTLMGFRFGGWYGGAYEDIGTNLRLGEDLTPTGSLGTVWCAEAIVAGNNFAVRVYGSTNAVVVRALADNAPVGLYETTMGTSWQGGMFYDAARNRIIVTSSSGLDFNLIDLTAGTVTAHEFTAAVGGDTDPLPSTLLRSCVMTLGNYVFGATPAGGASVGTTLYIVNPDSLVCTATYTYEAGGVPDVNMMLAPLLLPKGAGSAKPYVLSFDSNNVKRLYVGSSEMGGQSLSSVVTDLSNRAGLEGRTDTTALTDIVDGYTIAQQTNVGPAVAALAPAYYFDGVESGGVVKFVKRGGAIAAVIDDDDLAAADDGSNPGDPLSVRRQMEEELPHTLAANHMLRATNYQVATKIAKRLIGSSRDEATLDMPLVLTDAKAQEVVEVNLHNAWVQRVSFAFNLPRKYSYLEPTDVIVVKDHTMRLTKVVATPTGVLKCEAVRDDSHHYTPNVEVTETPAPAQAVFVPAPTRLELM